MYKNCSVWCAKSRRGQSIKIDIGKPIDKSIPYFPVYKSTFQVFKISPKNRPRLIHQPKLDGHLASQKITPHWHNNRLQSGTRKGNETVNSEKDI